MPPYNLGILAAQAAEDLPALDSGGDIDGAAGPALRGSCRRAWWGRWLARVLNVAPVRAAGWSRQGTGTLSSGVRHGRMDAVKWSSLRRVFVIWTI